MSAWQLVNAWSGQHADFVDGTLDFTPATKGDQRLFWSAGTAFGTVVIENGKARIEVLGGKLPPVKVTVNVTAI